MPSPQPAVLNGFAAAPYQSACPHSHENLTLQSQTEASALPCHSGPVMKLTELPFPTLENRLTVPTS